MTSRTRQWTIATVGAVLYFSFTYTWNSLAALIPLIVADLALSEFKTGIVLGTVALTIFFTWPIVGPWIERAGPAWAMGVGVIALGVAGMSRAFVHSFPGLVATMVVISLGGSTITYGLPSVISSWFTPSRSGTPLGVVSVGATLGTVLSFETMPDIVTLVGGWRPALVVSGVPALAAAGLWVLVGGDGPHRNEESESPDHREILALLRRPDVLTLILAGSMYLFATHSVYGWLSPLLIDRGLGTDSATSVIAVVTSGMIVGSLIVPYIADRTGRHAALIGGGGTVFSICIAALATVHVSFPPLAFIALLAGIAIGSISPLLRRLPLDIVPSGSISTVLGMVFGLGALGGFLGPVIIGAVQGWAGTTVTGFGVLALPGPALILIAARLYRE